MGRIDCCWCLSLYTFLHQQGAGQSVSPILCLRHPQANSGPKLIHMAEWRGPSAEGRATRWRKGFSGPAWSLLTGPMLGSRVLGPASPPTGVAQGPAGGNPGGRRPWRGVAGATLAIARATQGQPWQGQPRWRGRDRNHQIYWTS